MKDSQHCGKKKQSSPEKVSKKAAEAPQRHKKKISCTACAPIKVKRKGFVTFPKKFPINTM